MGPAGRRSRRSGLDRRATRTRSAAAHLPRRRRRRRRGIPAAARAQRRTGRPRHGRRRRRRGRGIDRSAGRGGDGGLARRRARRPGRGGAFGDADRVAAALAFAWRPRRGRFRQRLGERPRRAPGGGPAALATRTAGRVHRRPGPSGFSANALGSLVRLERLAHEQLEQRRDEGRDRHRRRERRAPRPSVSGPSSGFSRSSSHSPGSHSTKPITTEDQVGPLPVDEPHHAPGRVGQREDRRADPPRGRRGQAEAAGGCWRRCGSRGRPRAARTCRTCCHHQQADRRRPPRASFSSTPATGWLTSQTVQATTIRTGSQRSTWWLNGKRYSVGAVGLELLRRLLEQHASGSTKPSPARACRPPPPPPPYASATPPMCSRSSAKSTSSSSEFAGHGDDRRALAASRTFRPATDSAALKRVRHVGHCTTTSHPHWAGKPARPARRRSLRCASVTLIDGVARARRDATHGRSVVRSTPGRRAWCGPRPAAPAPGAVRRDRTRGGRQS